MRDSVTDDDLAVEAAKQKLAELTVRDDYKAALARVHKPERGPAITVTALLLLSGGSAVVVGWLAHGIAAWIGAALLGMFAVFMALALLGFAQEKPGEPVGVAVIAKLRDANNITELRLLRADSTEVTAIVTDTIFDLVKPGDLGVAWLRKDGSHHVVKELERL